MSDNSISLSSSEEMGSKSVHQKISVSGDHHDVIRSSKPDDDDDSFVVVDMAMPMERCSHLMVKDINSNSRITRNLSRKGSIRNGEMKISVNDKDVASNTSMLTTSPGAALHGGSSTPEKPGVVAMGSTDQPHHHITITNGSVVGEVAAESKRIARRLSFRRNPPTWASDPRSLLAFFATLSSVGTILLIYFTLSVGKLNQDSNASI
ncbi:hypothetical protein OROGR_003220 [Orobanche gracilis]